jgi:hypothetical protein
MEHPLSVAYNNHSLHGATHTVLMSVQASRLMN